VTTPPLPVVTGPVATGGCSVAQPAAARATRGRTSASFLIVASCEEINTEKQCPFREPKKPFASQPPLGKLHAA
jgi:hypothetical protein